MIERIRAGCLWHNQALFSMRQGDQDDVLIRE